LFNALLNIIALLVVALSGFLCGKLLPISGKGSQVLAWFYTCRGSIILFLKKLAHVSISFDYLREMPDE